MLFYGMTSLLLNILENFVSKKSLCSYADGSRKMKNENVSDLVQLNLEKKENLKPSNFIDVGTKVKTIISDFDNESDKKKFYSVTRNIAAVSYLQNNLPFNIKIIEYSQYLHPQKRNCSASGNAISNLYLKIVKVFGSKVPKIFELPLDSTSDSIVDVVRHQWKMYQLEHIT